ncbi:bacillithiol biosynthesis cysteine-adding enzyme BshC [Paenibacillus sacheonensis]|uniref:Putative cysteine ligase BshC n=1 Tax=Paenibacillus sacheonensis TaxID=742054 RepID=A0A7X4YTF6_9BACL|nr:bacillithiol biosynthesis cysteine-adding enzyme BshC [Paenibacillus sacheonensis]MBM7565694.1 bacillithiol biosynthesis cysteine-adding enzyme BshC [Paenibacillus sacheonensis]NBC72248.1 bacillithiol biosynthesis cysteine-adding enzyme BshC [Paenibacillus sacheonensis]
MRTESVQLPFSQPIAEAYVKRSHPGIEALFGSHPAEEAHWHRRLNWLKAHADKRVASERLAEVLLAYNKRTNDHPSVLANIEAIREGAPVVVTGQQAGLWTGPLLVIHKAVTAIAAAKDASRMTGTEVVPVFWIAGEDHDWDEANHAFIRSGEATLARIAVPRPFGVRTSVSRTKLEQAKLTEALQRLSASLPDTAFKRELLETLEGFAVRCNDLSEWFALTMGWLFGKYGLVLMDSDDAGVRALEAPMFKRILLHNDELEAAYMRTAGVVRELGYALPADVSESCANVFLFEDEERVLLYKQDGDFRNRKETLRVPREELLRIAEQEPQRLSNNVLTRPLMQDYLLPVLGAVLGHGEIAYWTLTGEAFRCLGMEMPLIIPRMSYTLVEGTVEKHMAKYGLTFNDVAERYEEHRAGWLKERDELDIEGRFDAARTQFETMYKPVMEMSASIGRGLEDLGAVNLRRIQDQISYLEKRTKEAHARRFDTALQQQDGVALALWPDNQPQERILNMADIWNRSGSAWLDKLLDAPYDRSGGHYLIYL